MQMFFYSVECHSTKRRCAECLGILHCQNELTYEMLYLLTKLESAELAVLPRFQSNFTLTIFAALVGITVSENLNFTMF